MRHAELIERLEDYSRVPPTREEAATALRELQAERDGFLAALATAQAENEALRNQLSESCMDARSSIEFPLYPCPIAKQLTAENEALRGALRQAITEIEWEAADALHKSEPVREDRLRSLGRALYAAMQEGKSDE